MILGIINWYFYLILPIEFSHFASMSHNFICSQFFLPGFERFIMHVMNRLYVPMFWHKTLYLKNVPSSHCTVKEYYTPLSYEWTPTPARRNNAAGACSAYSVGNGIYSLITGLYNVHTCAIQYLLYKTEPTLLSRSSDAPVLSHKCWLSWDRMNSTAICNQDFV